MPDAPRLLVSLRNREEALSAAELRVDLIDFKEPERGALGMVPPNLLHDAILSVSERYPLQQISVACGEVTDPFPGAVPCLSGVRYVKLGLSGLRGRPNWVSLWRSRREQLLESFYSQSVLPPEWIGVAYVDGGVADSPPIEDVIQASIDTGCGGVLFDTFHKESGTLFDSLTEVQLQSLTSQIQQAGLLVAAAGRLTGDHLPAVVGVGVDYVGIRSAACRNFSRGESLSVEKLRRFQDALRREIALTG